MSQHPRSLASSILGVCLMLLASAVAVYVAAKLVLAVLPVLIGLAIASVIGFSAFALYRAHQNRW